MGPTTPASTPSAGYATAPTASRGRRSELLRASTTAPERLSGAPVDVPRASYYRRSGASYLCRQPPGHGRASLQGLGSDAVKQAVVNAFARSIFSKAELLRSADLNRREEQRVLEPVSDDIRKYTDL